MEARTGKVKWDTVTDDGLADVPVVAGKRAYFGCTTLQAVDKETGKVAWTFKTGSEQGLGTPVILGKTLFLKTGSEVIALPL